WRDPTEYAACQQLAVRARAKAPPVQAIRYESCRREGGLCVVVFDPQALKIANPCLQQTWTCKTTSQRVMLSHETESFQFEMG
ncbi:MAG TPA: RES domain-containing protein, partial [Ramlibacter sp.]|nr:RES domain-containing protein [Ramlibacter sp.]